MTDLRYPIGPLVVPESITSADRAGFLAAIAVTPARLRAAVAGLDDRRLDTPYRPGGWTVRQVAHHVADSHIHAYTRCKLALTEDNPTIKPYLEARWAELPDSSRPIGGSLALLDHLHERWVALLVAVPGESFRRTYFHPESEQQVRLDGVTAAYAWHGAHHVAHITALRRREGW